VTSTDELNIGKYSYIVEADVKGFFKALASRLNKFGLELTPDKTNIISFSRFRKVENTYFEFLGFEYRWGV
jgi:hypothetical protein